MEHFAWYLHVNVGIWVFVSLVPSDGQGQYAVDWVGFKKQGLSVSPRPLMAERLIHSSVSAVLVVEWPLVAAGGVWGFTASCDSPLRLGFSWGSGWFRGATDTRVLPWFSSSAMYDSSACRKTRYKQILLFYFAFYTIYYYYYHQKLAQKT